MGAVQCMMCVHMFECVLCALMLNFLRVCLNFVHVCCVRTCVLCVYVCMGVLCAFCLCLIVSSAAALLCLKK